jgi:hypothetical protein
MSASSATKSEKPKAKTAKKHAKEKAALFDVHAPMKVIIPTSLSAEPTGGECSILVQIGPEDATLLDFEGAQGAIGRFEADDSGVTLDLKGYQYHGKIHSGPTALVLVVGKTGQLKVDAITDEFVILEKTQDVMAKLNAVVKGNMDDGYNVVEENVNINKKGERRRQGTIRKEKKSVGQKEKDVTNSEDGESTRKISSLQRMPWEITNVPTDE